MAMVMAGRGTWALVGLSNNRSRAAYGVASFLLDKGIRVVPVHPHAHTVHGQPGYTSLAAAARAVGPIDVVDVFVRSELAGPVVDEAIAIGASAVWMQLGVVDEAAAARARAAGLLTIMDACPAQEWGRLVPAHSEQGVAIRPASGGRIDEACAWAPPPQG